MRFSFDPRKSKRLRTNPQRGIGFEEAQELFSMPYWLDRRSDVPEQYVAIGWVRGGLYSVIFEIREDEEGGDSSSGDTVAGDAGGDSHL
jgi:uncharacterized DUF497 family protein